MSLGSDLWVQLSETNSDTFVQTNLTDEDTNSILTDNANKAFQSNMAMQVTQPGDQLWNQMQGCHLMTKF